MTARHIVVMRIQTAIVTVLAIPPEYVRWKHVQRRDIIFTTAEATVVMPTRAVIVTVHATALRCARRQAVRRQGSIHMMVRRIAVMPIAAVTAIIVVNRREMQAAADKKDKEDKEDITVIMRKVDDGIDQRRVSGVRITVWKTGSVL